MARAKKERDYEVEAICKARVNYKKGRKIHWQYLVKWEGYGEKDNTWEPSECFEESPGLLKAFWRHVDIGKRKDGEDKKVTSPGDFKVHDELSPRDGPVSASEVTDVDEKVEEKRRVGNKKPAQTRAVRRKRSLSENEVSVPRRKRGRPSEKAMADTNGDAADAEGDPDTAADGDGASQVADENNGPRRASQRLSENLSSDENIETRAEQIKKNVQHRPSADATAPDTMGESHKTIKTPLSVVTGGKPKSRRKAYIETDEDADGETDNNSQAGSLFSECQGSENGNEGEKIEEVQAEVVSSYKELTSASASPIDGPQAFGPTKSSNSDASKLEEMRKRLLAKRNAQKPRVILTDDPDVTKAIQERLGKATKPSADEQAIEPEAEASNVPLARKSKTPPRAVSSVPESRPTASFKPTLLTWEKGRLASQRRKVGLPTHVSPITPSSADMAAVDEQLGYLEDGNMNGGDTNPTNDAIMGDRVGDTVHNEPAQASILAPTEPSIPQVPPTAAELLDLAGIKDNGADLPDFDVEDGEVTNEMPGFDAEEGEVINEGPENIINGMPHGSSARGEEAQAIVQGSRLWAQNTIFAPAAPAPGLEIISKVDVSAEPVKSLIKLRLDPSTAISTAFKDVHPASWNWNENLVSLLPGEHDGLPAKLYPQDVIDHLSTGGSSSRLVVDESSGDEQKELLTNLIGRLEENRELLITVANCQTLVMIPSQNRDAAARLNFPSSLIGLRKTMIVQNVRINNDTAFMNYALEAKDFKI